MRSTALPAELAPAMTRTISLDQAKTRLSALVDASTRGFT
jgi:hypothetical protein